MAPAQNPAWRKQFRDQFKKTKLCWFNALGSCKYGQACTFAHGLVDLEISPDLSKPAMCRGWQNGCCPLSTAECRYAHGSEELRFSPAFRQVQLSKRAQPKDAGHASFELLDVEDAASEEGTSQESTKGAYQSELSSMSSTASTASPKSRNPSDDQTTSSLGSLAEFVLEASIRGMSPTGSPWCSSDDLARLAQQAEPGGLTRHSCNDLTPSAQQPEPVASGLWCTNDDLAALMQQSKVRQPNAAAPKMSMEEQKYRGQEQASLLPCTAAAEYPVAAPRRQARACLPSTADLRIPTHQQTSSGPVRRLPRPAVQPQPQPRPSRQARQEDLQERSPGRARGLAQGVPAECIKKEDSLERLFNITNEMVIGAPPGLAEEVEKPAGREQRPGGTPTHRRANAASPSSASASLPASAVAPLAPLPHRRASQGHHALLGTSSPPLIEDEPLDPYSPVYLTLGDDLAL